MLDMQVSGRLALVVAYFGFSMQRLVLLKHFEVSFGREDRRRALMQQSSAGISPPCIAFPSGRTPTARPKFYAFVTGKL